MYYPVCEWIQGGRTTEFDSRHKEFVQTFSEACSFLVRGQHQVSSSQVESHMPVNVKVDF